MNSCASMNVPHRTPQDIIKHLILCDINMFSYTFARIHPSEALKNSKNGPSKTMACNHIFVKYCRIDSNEEFGFDKSSKAAEQPPAKNYLELCNVKSFEFYFAIILNTLFEEPLGMSQWHC